MEIKEITRMSIQMEKLHKDGNYADISSLLTDIYNTHVTLEQLQTTDIAKNVYQLLKSCPVASVRKKGKGVLSKWKRLYGQRREHQNINGASHPEECEAAEQDRAGRSEEDPDDKVNDDGRNTGFKADKSNVGQGSSSTGDTSLNAKTVPPPEDGLGSTLTVPSLNSSSTVLRNKCVELLIQALNPDKTDPELTSQLAHTIEAHINTTHGHNPAKYKSCIRSKVANLKNPKNPHLRQGLLSGTLAPEVFTQMSPQEMAGDELRQLRQGYTAAGISEHQLPRGPEGTATTKVRCQRCDGMDCRVTQISRGTLFLPSWVKRDSADEAAMTFMTCANCGAQWYHNRWVCL